MNTSDLSEMWHSFSPEPAAVVALWSAARSTPGIGGCSAWWKTVVTAKNNLIFHTKPINYGRLRFRN